MSVESMKRNGDYDLSSTEKLQAVGRKIDFAISLLDKYIYPFEMLGADRIVKMVHRVIEDLTDAQDLLRKARNETMTELIDQTHSHSATILELALNADKIAGLGKSSTKEQ